MIKTEIQNNKTYLFINVLYSSIKIHILYTDNSDSCHKVTTIDFSFEIHL